MNNLFRIIQNECRICQKHIFHPFRSWLQDTVVFFATVVAPVLLILLANTVVFVMVLIQIRKIRANKSSSNSRSAAQGLRAMASISVLLGVTWSMGFLSFGPGRVILMYLFTICNSFQGKRSHEC